MADAQADSAQTTPQGDDKGAEPQHVPVQRFEEVIKERNQDREELARQREDLAAARAELQALKASQQPKPEPPEDELPEQTVERVMKKVIEPYNQVIARMYDELDDLKYQQTAKGLPAEQRAEADKLRAELQKKGVYATREDAMALAIGRKTLAESRRASAEEADRAAANASGLAGLDARGSSRAATEPDLSRLSPEERAKAYADRLGDTPL